MTTLAFILGLALGALAPSGMPLLQLGLAFVTGVAFTLAVATMVQPAGSALYRHRRW